MRPFRPFPFALFLFAALFAAAPGIPLAAPPDPSEPRSAEEGTGFTCLGLLTEEEEAKRTGALDYRVVDLEPYPIRLAETVSARDSVYIVELFQTLVPYMEKVYGPVLYDGALGFSIDSTLTNMAYAGYGALRMPRISPTIGADGDGDGLVDEDPYNGIDDDGDGRIDEDPDNVPSWDNMFIHELTHVWQSQLIWSPITPNWLVEAFARAAEYLIPFEAERDGCPRRLGIESIAEPVANLDLHDEAGAQVLGGGIRLIDRVDRNLAYRHAGATLLLPIFAELAEGRSAPHPMRRFVEEMNAERLSYEPRILRSAVDRAWNSPVDGVFPPSRWLSARSIAFEDFRLGSFLALFPTAASGGVNPGWLYVLLFERVTTYSYDYRTDGRVLVYTGPAGSAVQPLEEGPTFIHPPALPPGAYLVEAEATGAEGESLRARTWILKTADGRNAFSEWGGSAVVFAGPDGIPYDPVGLRTNGRIVERVPGGAIVDLPGGGSLHFESDAGPLGTITIPEGFPRFAVIGANRDPSEGVVSWSPYHPRPGEEVTVFLHKGDSPLDSGGSDPLLSVSWSTSPLQVFLSRIADPDLWTCRIRVPPGTEYMHLHFSSRYDDGHRFRYFAVPPILFDTESGAGFLEARVEGGRLVLLFDGWANRSRYHLASAPSDDGPWTERPDPPRPLNGDATLLAWDLDDGAAGLRYRVIERAYGMEKTLVTLAHSIGTESAAEASAPFPNPSRAAVRWTIETPRPMDADFSVYNAAGRRVHGPETLRIDAGSAEILWDGRTSSGRRAAEGVYLLRIAAPGFEATRKVVLIGK
ncbi:MAG: hypothetical protein JW958_00220 [Candidatus Eisenbacteria bacterium]|nr:hypothetical protein [Candidatus Eisenbacteria bacterium]